MAVCACGSIALWRQKRSFSSGPERNFGSIQEQRYLLEIDLPEFQLLQRLGQTPQIRQHSLGQVVLPLPRLLARSREKANLCRCFCRKNRPRAFGLYQTGRWP